MKTRDFYQEYIFPAAPARIYEILMDSERHSEFTGSEARINAVVGGEYSTYDDYIIGVNKSLVPGKYIEQTWLAREEDWPEEHYSIVIFELEPHADGTLLKFHQKEIPEEIFEAISSGWAEFYWEPLKYYLEEEAR